MELLTAPRADELSVLLEQIDVRSVVYCLSDLGAPWGLQVDGSAAAKFHLVLDGRATLTLDEPGAAPAELSAGELALLPHGSGHAAGYLSATDKTVGQIARMVGYSSEASLSKAFRRAFGRAPGQYRRQQAAAHGVRATATG